MTEIAERQGYATLTAFSVAFKRHTGLTPSVWRRAAL
ncbi:MULTISPECIES: helix-turn-helix domain-containing protein [Agrobacterium]|uniref:AraC family transcriptional regulator n=1 Tax=Agrobacterium tumefaciens TaxID=358 RepID=A0AAE6EIF5_AGRTU|nr:MULTISPECIES: helix-turn-helix domain-containing protein [Agrobacterium]QCL77148.1 AraC family transcriptional regulator [Agrobacterium tumefaciens]QCL82656.1 AraC family transcriptional regulator [Agrobacterium tumefaciens]